MCEESELEQQIEDLKQQISTLKVPKVGETWVNDSKEYVIQSINQDYFYSSHCYLAVEGYGKFYTIPLGPFLEHFRKGGPNKKTLLTQLNLKEAQLIELKTSKLITPGSRWRMKGYEEGFYTVRNPDVEVIKGKDTFKAVSYIPIWGQQEFIREKQDFLDSFIRDKG